MYSVEMLDQRIDVQGWEGSKFHHTTQNCLQFKSDESFICGLFHLMCSDLGWPWVTKTMESKARNEETAVFSEIFDVTIAVLGCHESHPHKPVNLIDKCYVCSDFFH